jgi:hypothetical protein
MKALKALKEHRARRGSDEEEEETEGTIWKPENGKGQQKVWSLRDSGDDFAMFSFKIVPCSKTCAHDWTVCPYAHCGEIARRRDLKMFSYSAIPCADYQKVPTSRAKGKGSHEYSCPRGANCPYAHGIFESWLHPSRYRTQLCKDGLGCTRKACFFAHKAKELRSVASDNINADSNNNYNSNMSTANKFATMTTTMTTATMQQQQQQQQQQHNNSKIDRNRPWPSRCGINNSLNFNNNNNAVQNNDCNRVDRTRGNPYMQIRKTHHHHHNSTFVDEASIQSTWNEDSISKTTNSLYHSSRFRR